MSAIDETLKHGLFRPATWHWVCRAALALLCLSAFSSPHVSAADFRIGPPSQSLGQATIVNLEGPIEAGDARRFEKFTQHLAPSAAGITISLNSPGGDFAEGLKIGHLINNSGFGTVVRAGDTCASACAFAFLGGFYQDEAQSPNRMLEVGSRLQFHAPYVDTNLVNVDQAEILRELTDVTIQLNKSLAYTFEVPPEIVETLLLNDKKHSLYTVESIKMLELLKIRVLGVYQPKSLTLEMATHMCVNALTNGQLDETLELQKTEKLRRIPSDDIAVIPVVVIEEELTNMLCAVQRMSDGTFECSSSIVEIKSASDLLTNRGENCSSLNSLSLLAVPATTKLQDYKNVAQKMEARGKSIFDTASLPSAAAPTKSEKPVGKLNSQAFICNDQAGFANMREGPNSSDHAVVAKLPNNARINVLEETSNPESGHPWLKVSANGKKGFVDKDLVSSETCTTASASVVEAATGFTPGNAVICNNDASCANMRSGAGPSNDLIAALDNNTPVKKLAAAVNEETQHPWLKIQAKGKTGYVDAEKVAANCDIQQ